MSEISIQAFLKEKLHNFITFLKSVLKGKCGLINELHKLECMPMLYFIKYINDSLVPFKEDLDKYLTKMCLEYNLNIYDFNDDDKIKFKRYCLCFIDIVQSP